jgi:hypothetical protein
MATTPASPGVRRQIVAQLRQLAVQHAHGRAYALDICKAARWLEQSSDACLKRAPVYSSWRRRS